MKQQLIFDVTDATTILASDSVGAFVRAGDGTLIGHVSDALKVSLTNASIAVTATDLDIRDLNSATDSVTAIQGTSPWVVGDGGGSLTVDAVDLDIRNLSHAQDNVAIAQGGNTMVVNADGSINVNADISVVNGHEKAEDAAHASGAIGSYVLAVRQDTLASSTDADGDYASLKVNATGALYTYITGSNPLTMDDAALANTAIANAANVLTAANTAENVVTSPLSNRKYLYIYNNGNLKAYIGASGVSAANGFPLPPGSMIELRAGAAVDIEWVAANTNQELRTLELA